MGTLKLAIQLILRGLIEMNTDRGSVRQYRNCSSSVGFSFPILVDQVDAPPDRYSEWRVHGIKLPSFGSSFDQQRLYLFRGCVLHVRQNMRINVECERHTGMSHLFTDDFWGDSRDQ